MGSQYHPTTEELTIAVSELLRKHEKLPSLRVIVVMLRARNSTWKIPKRRVQKFVKRLAPANDNTSVPGVTKSTTIEAQASIPGTFSKSQATLELHQQSMEARGARSEAATSTKSSLAFDYSEEYASSSQLPNVESISTVFSTPSELELSICSDHVTIARDYADSPLSPEKLENGKDFCRSTVGTPSECSFLPSATQSTVSVTSPQSLQSDCDSGGYPCTEEYHSFGVPVITKSGKSAFRYELSPSHTPILSTNFSVSGSSLSTAKSQHQPTSEELAAAISEVLHKQQHEKLPHLRDVIRTLQTRNSRWKIPERRVQKFIKRQVRIGENQTLDSDGHQEGNNLLGSREQLEPETQTNQAIESKAQTYPTSLTSSLPPLSLEDADAYISFIASLSSRELIPEQETEKQEPYSTRQSPPLSQNEDRYDVSTETDETTSSSILIPIPSVLLFIWIWYLCVRGWPDFAVAIERSLDHRRWSNLAASIKRSLDHVRYSLAVWSRSENIDSSCDYHTVCPNPDVSKHCALGREGVDSSSGVQKHSTFIWGKANTHFPGWFPPVPSDTCSLEALDVVMQI